MGGRGNAAARNTGVNQNTELKWSPERKNRNIYVNLESASLYNIEGLDVPADYRYREVGNDSWYIDRVYTGRNGQAYDRVQQGVRTRYSTLSDAVNRRNEKGIVKVR